MDPRTPGGSEPQADPAEVPEAPDEAPAPAPSQPAPMPWERPQSQPPAQPHSTIISAEPVLTDQPGAPGPEVSWAPPPSTQERNVPGAPGFVFAGTSRRFVAWVIDNIVLTIAVAVLAGIAAVALSIDMQRDSTAATAAFSVIYVALSFVYFVLFWTSKRPATPGMRAMKIQIGTAFDGRPLAFGPAILRWALLGYPLSLIYLVPSIAGPVSLLAFVWYIVLLLTTIGSDTKQGLHDQAARTAVVQPAALGRSVLVTACLVLVVGWVLLWVALLVLIFLGGQISSLQPGSSV
jgi:uncharacterized RDD family membrane protein YckC